MKNVLYRPLAYTFSSLNLIGLWLGKFSLRLLLGWDFFESGLEKFNGSN